MQTEYEKEDVLSALGFKKRRRLLGGGLCVDEFEELEEKKPSEECQKLLAKAESSDLKGEDLGSDKLFKNKKRGRPRKIEII